MQHKTETPAAWRTAGEIFIGSGGIDERLGDVPIGGPIGCTTLIRRAAR